MKRTLAIAGLVAAATFAPASPAQANHICVYRHGEPVVCTLHVESPIEEICVSSGGQNVVCTP